MPDPTIAVAPPNPEAGFHKDTLARSNTPIVEDVTVAASIDLRPLANRWINIKCEGTAGERVGFIMHSTLTPLATSPGGAVDPDLAARAGAAGVCDAIDTGTTIRRYVYAPNLIMRVIASAGTLVLRITEAQL